MFGNHGLCGLPEEGAHEKSPKCLGGNLGDFGELCKGLIQIFACQQHGHQHERDSEAEQETPMGVVDDNARQRGPQRGGDGEHHGNHAHGRAAFLRRVNRHNAVEQQGDEERGRNRLHHAPRNQQRKHGRKRANQRAQQEGGLREQQHFFGGQPLNQVGGDGGERAHYQQKARGQPLHGGFVHAEILHDGRERDIEQRVVQIAEKRADKQGGNNGFGMVLAGNCGLSEKYSCWVSVDSAGVLCIIITIKQ